MNFLFRLKPSAIGAIVALSLSATIFCAVLYQVASGSFRTEPSEAWTSPYEKEAIAALKRSLPSHYETILQREDLSEKQKHALKMLYGPAIENFVESGELDQLGRVNALESLILSGALTAEPRS